MFVERLVAVVLASTVCGIDVESTDAEMFKQQCDQSKEVDLVEFESRGSDTNQKKRELAVNPVFDDVTYSQLNSQFSYYNNKDYYGNDLPSVPNVNSADDCAAICWTRLHQGCTGFTWLDSTSTLHPNRCFPKKGELSVTGLTDLADAVTGLLKQQPHIYIRNFRIFFEKDFYGSDLQPSVGGVTSAEDCAVICRQRFQEGCTGFTWLDRTTKYPNRCFPKKGVLLESHLSAFPGAATGLLNENHQGYDELSFTDNVDDYNACDGLCADQEGCASYVWVNTLSSPERCYLQEELVRVEHPEAAEVDVGFLDTLRRSSDFHIVNDRVGGYVGGLIDLLPFREMNADSPSDCANMSVDLFADGCTGYSWLPDSEVGPPKCLFLRGALLTRDLIVLDGAVTGILQPLCSEGGYMAYSGTAITDDLVPINTLSPSTASACEAFFAEKVTNGFFYDFSVGSDGVGICRVYGKAFDLNFLTAVVSSTTSVPCGPNDCFSSGFRLYSDISLDTGSVLPVLATSPVGEVQCRSHLQFHNATFYVFTSLGAQRGSCEVYDAVFFGNNFGRGSGNSSAVVRCEPHFVP